MSLCLRPQPNLRRNLNDGDTYICFCSTATGDLHGGLLMSVTAQVQLRILEYNSGKRVLQQKWMGTEKISPYTKTIVEEWRNVPVVLEAATLEKVKDSIADVYRVTYTTNTSDNVTCIFKGRTMKEALENFLNQGYVRLGGTIRKIENISPGHDS